MPEVFVLNGVNLASLGQRRPEVYGEQTLQDIEQLLHNTFPNVELEFLNPGAWTHYSCAIHDALEIIALPNVEVQLSNVHAREEGWRRTSVISPVVDAVVTGMPGAFGYLAAIRYILGIWDDGGGT